MQDCPLKNGVLDGHSLILEIYDILLMSDCNDSMLVSAGKIRELAPAARLVTDTVPATHENLAASYVDPSGHPMQVLVA